MTPYPSAPKLPESSQSFVARDLLDVLTQQGRNRDLNIETVQKNLDNTQSAHQIAMSTAMHPDTLAVESQRKNYRILIENDDDNKDDRFVLAHKSIESSAPRSLASLPDEPSSVMSFGPISNPAAYYLRGAHFDEIAKPKCYMVGCEGPYPNDGNIRLVETRAPPGSTCHQSWIALNECVENRGYPVGMLCTICCECADDFNNQMHQSRGYIENW